MPTTLREVAAKLNLSPSLISGVLNNRPGVWASQETRQRILDAARELGYRPHAAARALRSGKTHCVCLVFVRPHPENGEGAIHDAIEALAVRLGAMHYDLTVKALESYAAMRNALNDMMCGRTCDGLVLWGREEALAACGDVLSAGEVPFVAKGRLERLQPDWHQADYDHEGMMAEIVRRFAAHGRRRIAYIGFRSADCWAQRLLEGFGQAVLAETGRPADPALVFEGSDDVDEAAAVAARWMRLPEDARPDAVALAAGNNVWLGLEVGLARCGVRIGYAPGQVEASGLSFHTLRLLYGESEAYVQADLSSLADALADRMLCPLLDGRAVDPHVLRILPPMRPLAALDLPHAPGT